MTRHPACPPTCRGVRTKDGLLLPFVRGKDCAACWRWTAHKFQRKKHGGDPDECLLVAVGVVREVAPAATPPPKPARVALPTRAPCRYEGPVAESCKTCNGQDRHVRWCNHPDPSDPDRDHCTRNHPASTLQRCADCPDYVKG